MHRRRPGERATGQSRRGAATVEDMVIAIEYEKASPRLLEKCLQGEIVPKLEIELVGTQAGIAGGRQVAGLANDSLTMYDRVVATRSRWLPRPAKKPNPESR
ncbi:MAG: type VI secretion system tube protein Hcp [bacterium]|nr:type VI secretion system tube protein Hcp [bacterium]